MAGDTNSTTSGTVTFTTTSFRHTKFTAALTGTLTCKLPTGATILKGDTFRFDLTYANVATTNELTVVADDSTAVGAISDYANICSGYVVVRALQANPTTGTHWEVVDVYEVRKTTASASYNNGTTTNASWILKLSRKNLINNINLVVSTVGQPSTGTSSRIDTSVVLPVRYRPIDSPHNIVGKTRQTAADANIPGFWSIQTDGSIRYTCELNGTGTFASAANSGGSGNMVASYANTAN